MGANPRLRTAVAAGKSAAMPKDNIERAIKKGTGEIEGESYDEMLYEGYGPGGVALLIEAATNNKNRTVANVRNILDKHGGSLGQTGSVAWQFEKQGRIEIGTDGTDEDTITGAAIEAGAADVVLEDDCWVVTTDPSDFHEVRQKLEDQNVAIAQAMLTMIPQSTVTLEGQNAETMVKLLDALDDDEDVQNVHANFEIDDAEMERLAG